MCVNAPEGCQHGTHTNGTAYPLGSYASVHTQAHSAAAAAMCTQPDARAREAPISPSDKRTHLVSWCVLDGRYSRAISSIENLLSVWHSMSYAQKASPVWYSRLILEGEAIINEERQAWQKTGGIREESEKMQKKSEVPSKVALADRMANLV